MKISNLYDDQIIPPLEKAIWWIEHTMRTNGSEYLRGDIRRAPLFRFYLFSDLIFILFIILCIIVILTYIFYTKSDKKKSD